MRQLSLLSANIQAGSKTRNYADYIARSWSHVLPAGNKSTALDAIARLIRNHDIVSLQESDTGSLRSNFVDQTQYLAKRADFSYYYSQTNRNISRIASSANALLSRIKPTKIARHPLPGRLKGRGILLAHFSKNHHGLLIAIIHLSLGAASRRMQIQYITELLHGHPHTVLMGDFNCTYDCKEMLPLYQNTNLQPPEYTVPTFPSWRPNKAIDHILIANTLTHGRLRALPATTADHLAVSIDIGVPEYLL